VLFGGGSKPQGRSTLKSQMTRKKKGRLGTLLGYLFSEWELGGAIGIHRKGGGKKCLKEKKWEGRSQKRRGQKPSKRKDRFIQRKKPARRFIRKSGVGSRKKKGYEGERKKKKKKRKEPRRKGYALLRKKEKESTRTLPLGTNHSYTKRTHKRLRQKKVQ